MCVPSDGTLSQTFPPRTPHPPKMVCNPFGGSLNWVSKKNLKLWAYPFFFENAYRNAHSMKFLNIFFIWKSRKHQKSGTGSKLRKRGIFVHFFGAQHWKDFLLFLEPGSRHPPTTRGGWDPPKIYINADGLPVYPCPSPWWSTELNRCLPFVDGRDWSAKTTISKTALNMCVVSFTTCITGDQHTFFMIN